MAITILGGLATATFLNLVVLPEALIRMQTWLGLAVRATAEDARNRQAMTITSN
jgi:hypothetical protein